MFKHIIADGKKWTVFEPDKATILKSKQIDFVRKDAKVVLKEILRLGNSRLFQADGGWYIISNHNYYDRSVLFAADTSCNQEDDITTKPAITTDDATNITETSATVNATITNAKGLDIISRGFYIGENAAFAANRAYFSTDTTAVSYTHLTLPTIE